jgi:hypothetical protein
LFFFESTSTHFPHPFHYFSNKFTQIYQLQRQQQQNLLQKCKVNFAATTTANKNGVNEANWTLINALKVLKLRGHEEGKGQNAAGLLIRTHLNMDCRYASTKQRLAGL